MACDPLSFFAWNDAGTIGLELSYPPITLSQRRATLRTNIAKSDVHVVIETGNNIPTNFCASETQIIPVQSVYEAQDGVVISTMKYNDSGQLTGAEAELNGVVFIEPVSGHKIQIPSLLFKPQSIQSKRQIGAHNVPLSPD